MKKKNVLAAQKTKRKKVICKNLQSEIVLRLQNKGLTSQLAQKIIESADDFIAEKMVEALRIAMRSEAEREV